jgi:hypothetical protein
MLNQQSRNTSYEKGSLTIAGTMMLGTCRCRKTSLLIVSVSLFSYASCYSFYKRAFGFIKFF